MFIDGIHAIASEISEDGISVDVYLYMMILKY